MRFDTSQQMRMGEHMRLAPRMIQSMEIPRMPLLQLEERIAQELESNVTLEQIEGAADAANADAVASSSAQSDAATDAPRPPPVDEKSGTDDFARLESYE